MLEGFGRFQYATRQNTSRDRCVGTTRLKPFHSSDNPAPVRWSSSHAPPVAGVAYGHRTHRKLRRQAQNRKRRNSTLGPPAMAIAFRRYGLAKLVASHNGSRSVNSPRGELDEKTSPRRSNDPGKAEFLSRMRRTADHQARLAQKQPSAAPNLFVQRLRQILFIPRRPERRQVSTARHCTGSLPL
jgi:hypothetical protein